MRNFTTVISKFMFGLAVAGAFAAVAASEINPGFFGVLAKAVSPQSAAAYGYEDPREMRGNQVTPPIPPSYGYENPRSYRYYVPLVVTPTSTTTRSSR